jgi:general secretion pathway protein G
MERPAPDNSGRGSSFGPRGRWSAVGSWRKEMKMKAIRSVRGFTLIELMVVVIIIAALAGMVLPRLMPATDAAKSKIARGDIANISVALKLYRLHNDRYPQALDELTKPSTSSDWKEPYLEKKPIDPWGHPYVYEYPSKRGNPVGFDLSSDGTDGQRGSSDDITNWEK